MKLYDVKSVFILIAIFFLFPITVSAEEVTEEWVARYNGLSNAYDQPHDIAVDSAGNVYVTGRSYDFSSNYDYVTIKYDTNGNELWTRKFNGIRNFVDLPAAIAVDSAGNVYVTGSSYVGYNLDYVTVKYDTNGNELWVKNYNGPGNYNDEPSDIVVDSSGNAYVTGKSYGTLRTSDWWSSTVNDYATIKYDTNGNELWVKRYDGIGHKDDAATSIALDGSGNVYVTGESSGIVPEGQTYYARFVDYATVKYDNNGNELWVKRYNGPGNNIDSAVGMAIDNSGNVYVTGHSSNSSQFSYWGIYYDIATIKYDATGNEVWLQRLNGPSNSLDRPFDIGVDSEGSVFVTGQSQGNGYITVKYDTAGNQLWLKSQPVVPSDLIVDNSDNAVITGFAALPWTSDDYATVKYDTDGNQLWLQYYHNFAQDEAMAMAADGYGNVYVAGQSQAPGFNYDIVTIKYNTRGPDRDGDGIPDNEDNCPDTPNTDQADMDTDGIGDVCDDTDGDGILDAYDACPYEDSTGYDIDNNGCIDSTSGLIDLVDTLVAEGVIDSVLKNSIVTKIENAEKSLDKENIEAAISQLGAFINEIEAQRGKKISDEAANQVIAYANSTINYLNSLLP